jgi:hypothetical protein
VALFDDTEILDRGSFAQAAKTICGCTSGSGRSGQPCSVNNGRIHRCDEPDRSIATELFHQKALLFQDHPRMLEQTKYEVEGTVDLQVFAEFVPALEGRRPETNPRNIGTPWSLCSKFGFEELLSARGVFGMFRPNAGVSSIEDEFRRRVRDIEENKLQNQRLLVYCSRKLSISRANSRLAAENMAQKQEMGALHKRHDELIARFAEAQSRSEDAIKCILQQLGTLRKQNPAPPPQKQFLFTIGERRQRAEPFVPCRQN